jgi:putative phosphoesterase
MASPDHNKLRRIGVIGDIHCEDQLLELALNHLRGLQLDLICTVGDLVDGPGNANRVIELLQADHVAAIRGNHERWLFAGEMRGLPDANSRFDLDSASWDYLPELPVQRNFETVAGRALLCHGLGDDDMTGVWPDDPIEIIRANSTLWRIVQSREYDFIINGHTHNRMVRTFDRLTIINAGALLRKHDPCFCIVDFENAVVRFFNVWFDGKVSEAEIFHLPLYSSHENNSLFP